MPALVKCVRWEVMFFLLALAALVAIRLLNGEINTSGLLYGADNRGNQSFSPGRVQLLVMTIAAAGQYVMLALNNPDPGTLPPVNNELLAVLMGSNAVYLSGKFYNIFLRGLLQSGNGRGQ
jgi:hypothetical protein